MDLSRVIIGQIVTEKSERLKENRTYTLRVAPKSTKVDVKAALKKYYDVDVLNVSIMRVMPKFRQIRSGFMQKRHPYKKAIVKLDPKSKPLDIAAFKI